VAKLQTQQPQLFGSQVSFLNHLAHKGIDLFDTGLIHILGEAGMWGTIRHHGLLGNTVIVSDDAGRFRVANHALCCVHSERLLQKLMPATPRQVQQVGAIHDLVWCFYKALKAWKLKPSPGIANAFRHRFDRIGEQTMMASSALEGCLTQRPHLVPVKNINRTFCQMLQEFGL
jgi:hypothetical protein